MHGERHLCKTLLHALLNGPMVKPEPKVNLNFDNEIKYNVKNIHYNHQLQGFFRYGSVSTP